MMSPIALRIAAVNFICSERKSHSKDAYLKEYA